MLVGLPLWLALGPGARLGILIEFVQIPGLVLTLAGAALWTWATVVLVARGRGTPLFVDPPVRLVTEGPYARIRSPMHVGLVIFLLGWALLFRSPLFLGWAVVATILVREYNRRLEEPALERRFGDAYRAYRARVPAWWPFGSARPPRRHPR